MAGMIPELVRSQWESETEKALLKGSFFAQLSNRTDRTAVFANESDAKMPDDVVHWVGAKQRKGSFDVNIPMVEKLYGDPIGGNEIAEGNEESVDMRYARAYWGVQRKAVRFDGEDDSVDGELESYLKIGAQRVDLLKDYMAELQDQCGHEALLDGGDQFITTQKYWTGVKSQSTPPVAKKMHPLIYYRGQSLASPITRSETYATDLANVIDAADVMTTASIFDKTALDACVRQAERVCKPLKWKTNSGRDVKFILLLSWVQIEQLLSDSTLTTLFKDADDRGIKNRAISGTIGNYRGVQIVQNERAPVFGFNAGSGYGEGWNYIKPSTDLGVSSIVGRTDIARTAKGATTVKTGCAEVAIMLGRGAIGIPKVSELKFHTMDSDYEFRKGFECRQKLGWNRMDYFLTGGNTRAHWSSFVYLTATTASSL